MNFKYSCDEMKKDYSKSVIDDCKIIVKHNPKLDYIVKSDEKKIKEKGFSIYLNDYSDGKIRFIKKIC